MEIISHVRKGEVQSVRFYDDTGDLCRLEIGRDRTKRVLALLFFENEGDQDPRGRANFNWVATIRGGVDGPQVHRIVSLRPTRGGRFRYFDAPPELRLSDEVSVFIEAAARPPRPAAEAVAA